MPDELYVGNHQISNKINAMDEDAVAEKTEQDLIQAAVMPGTAGTGIKVLRVPMATPADDSEVATGVTLPANVAVIDAFVQVTVAEATGTTKTLTLGTVEGDGNEFATAIDVSTTGFKRPQAVVTDGSAEKYFSANTRGAGLCDFDAGTDSAGDHGMYREKPDFASGGRQLAWTPGSTGWAEFVGVLYVLYIEMV